MGPDARQGTLGGAASLGVHGAGGQEVPGAGHASWTRSQRCPTATGAGHDTLLTRRLPNPQTPIPACARSGQTWGAQVPPRAHLCAAQRPVSGLDAPGRADTLWSRAPSALAQRHLEAGLLTSHCFKPSEAVWKLTHCNGTGGVTRRPHGDTPGATGPRQHPPPTLSCEADRSHRFSAATAQRRATPDSDGLTLLPTAGANGTELTKRLLNDQLSRTPHSGSTQVTAVDSEEMELLSGTPAHAHPAYRALQERA